MQTRGIYRSQAEDLASRVLSLREPWRQRFVSQIAHLAASPSAGASREGIVRLLEDRNVYTQARYMLVSWSGR